MSLVELFILAVGLSMDAFAVSICKGLSLGKISKKHMAIAGAWFGGFQALMPLLGYFLGKQFEEYIVSVDHWVAFALLAFIGGKMIVDVIKDDGSESCDAKKTNLKLREVLILALATSIDALAVGISFAFLKVDIGSAVLTIGVITLLLSSIGVVIGNKFGARYKNKATLAGGIILILIGTKILLEHLGIL